MTLDHGKSEFPLSVAVFHETTRTAKEIYDDVDRYRKGHAEPMELRVARHGPFGGLTRYGRPYAGKATVFGPPPPTLETCARKGPSCQVRVASSEPSSFTRPLSRRSAPFASISASIRLHEQDNPEEPASLAGIKLQTALGDWFITVGRPPAQEETPA